MHVLVHVLVLVLVLGCDPAGFGGDVECAEPEGARVAPVVYDADDRRDAFEVTDDALSVLATRSAVALMPARALRFDVDGVTLAAPSLGEALALCPGQPFAEQPRAAYCSGMLIDHDLVLTAGHCMKSDAQCRRTFLVFGYRLDRPDHVAAIYPEDVFTCRRIVLTSADAAVAADYAIVQLDRPATPAYRPAAVARTVLAGGDPLAMIGFGSGLPVKVDEGGRVLDPRSRAGDYFHVSLDAFEGSSGSGVLDVERALVGVLAGGAPDYVERCGCLVPNVLRTGEPGVTGEVAVYATHAIDALCDTGWPSARLCGASPSCSDGLCSGLETPVACPDDCAETRCGDSACDSSELFACAEDCGPAVRPTPVPASWLCAPDYYASDDGCDCDCGAPDPDCATSARIYNCREGEACGPDGRCSDY